jgi:hypothetical protein
MQIEPGSLKTLGGKKPMRVSTSKPGVGLLVVINTLKLILCVVMGFALSARTVNSMRG